MTAVLAALALLAVGYTLGRTRPVHRALNWANWQAYSRPTGLRRAAVWTLLSAENLTWLTLHPVQGWHAWQHRNDPPPPRSPAVKIRDLTEETNA
ncbi:hypothetical protein MQE23_08650 [Streptomyces sp. HP-A2021]|uniref:hypothetical protein n=1 Tax=Streptomyces sp. HP-A2021 TaxID=2927875 RepID=UPI001FAFD119|nr:hypothetical protein [Streptomyces sp. HP-A2021]UOB09121.1 hypothetical protein MQE23_08650 [Streptomyces sp. HP-A2021]